MPNITPAANALTLDDLRRQPSRLVTTHDLAELGVFKSYDAITRAVETGRLPKPYRIGLRLAWEARAVLHMLGAPLAVPEPEQPEAA